MRVGTTVGTLSVLGTALLVLAGCKDSNDITSPSSNSTPAPTVTPARAPTTTKTPPPTPPPTATPTPTAGSVSGAWTGTFVEEDYRGSSADCETHVDASATLQQTGSHVSGSFRIGRNACWSGGHIEGDLAPLPDGSGQTFDGQVSIGAGWKGGAFTGRVTSTTVTMGIDHLSYDLGNGTGMVAPGGLLTLHR